MLSACVLNKFLFNPFSAGIDSWKSLINALKFNKRIFENFFLKDEYWDFQSFV